jgi:hypothetical protein
MAAPDSATTTAAQTAAKDSIGAAAPATVKDAKSARDAKPKKAKNAKAGKQSKTAKADSKG